jgi:hypothetical protein
MEKCGEFWKNRLVFSKFIELHTYFYRQNKQTPWFESASPPLDGEVVPTVAGTGVSSGQRDGSLRP